MYCVRERGLAALKEPANVERLSAVTLRRGRKSTNESTS